MSPLVETALVADLRRVRAQVSKGCRGQINQGKRKTHDLARVQGRPSPARGLGGPAVEATTAKVLSLLGSRVVGVHDGHVVDEALTTSKRRGLLTLGLVVELTKVMRVSGAHVHVVHVTVVEGRRLGTHVVAVDDGAELERVDALGRRVDLEATVVVEHALRGLLLSAVMVEEESRDGREDVVAFPRWVRVLLSRGVVLRRGVGGPIGAGSATEEMVLAIGSVAGRGEMAGLLLLLVTFTDRPSGAVGTRGGKRVGRDAVAVGDSHGL